MKKSFEVKKGRVDIDYLWKIGKIDLDRVTFVKYDIERSQSLLNDNSEMLVLAGEIGEETHRCYPSIIEYLRGRVGDIVLGFDVEKKGRLVRVTRIKEIEKR